MSELRPARWGQQWRITSEQLLAASTVLVLVGRGLCLGAWIALVWLTGQRVFLVGVVFWLVVEASAWALSRRGGDRHREEFFDALRRPLSPDLDHF